MRRSLLCAVSLFLLHWLIAGSTAQLVHFTEDTYMISLRETYLDTYPPDIPVYPDPGSPRPTGSIALTGCVDTTTGGPANVTYSTVEATPGHIDSDYGPFVIDASDGNISVTADLDYEVRTHYTFHVRCRHNVQTSLTDTAIVRVEIEPINEYVPVVTSTFNPITLFESETLAPGTVLAFVSDGFELNTYQVTDLDEGGTEVLKYTLDMNPSQVTPNTEHLSLDPDTGTLTLTGSLDIDAYNFTSNSDTVRVDIQVCDMDPPSGICPNIRVVVSIFSANDNFPEFKQEMYEETVPEDLPVNSTLDLGIVCTDNDKGTGSLQGIELSDQNLTMWAVSSKGVVSLREPLDYETSQSHKFTIICLDTEGLTDEATVLISVGPVNDHSPYFDPKDYQFDVRRSKIPDYNVGRVTAFDDDIEEGNTITYSIITGDSNFEIDAKTGQITMVDYILASEDSLFTLLVRASDGTFTANSTVTIDIVGPLSAIGIGALTASIVLVVITATVVICLLCFRAVYTSQSTKMSHITKDGTEMQECRAYDVKPVDQELNLPNRDSAGYERIPALDRLPSVSAGRSPSSIYEPIPEEDLPWQFFYRPANPQNHYDYVRERPQLELPFSKRPELVHEIVIEDEQGRGGGHGMTGDGKERGKEESEEDMDRSGEGVLSDMEWGCERDEMAAQKQTTAVQTDTRYVNIVTGSTALEVPGPSAE